MNPIVCCIRVTTLCVHTATTALTTRHEAPHNSLSEHTLRASSLRAPPYCQLPYWRPSISLPFKAQALNTNGRGLGDRGRGTAPISPGALSYFIIYHCDMRQEYFVNVKIVLVLFGKLLYWKKIHNIMIIVFWHMTPCRLHKFLIQRKEC